MVNGTKELCRHFLLAAGLLLCVAAAAAQISTATLSGIVKDPSGAAIPNASVTVTQTQTNSVKEAVTDQSGLFNFTSLPVGPYSLRVHARGFQAYDQTGIVLTVGETSSVTVSLPVGEVSQTVEVTTSLPPVNTTDSTIQNTVDEATVVGLPLNGRNPATLVFDSAGVTNAGQNLGTGQLSSTSTIIPSFTIQGSIAPVVNGVRSGSTFFSLDGATNVDPGAMLGGPFPDPDATQEFQVVTGTYGAQYQSAPGGAVNIVTRSGTNKFHGTVFEFIRNGAVNAENAILGQRDTLKRNQFGGTIGGPILRDKLFFFGSYQGTRIAEQTVNVYPVPSAAERNGTFLACPIAAPTCTAQNEFPINLNTLPPIFGPNVQNPVNANFFNFKGSGNPLIPLANTANGTYVIGVPGHPNDEQFVARLDYALGQKHRVFARYYFDHQNQAPVGEPTSAPYNVLDTGAGGKNYFENSAIGDTWTPNARLVLNTRISFLNILAEADSATQNSFVNYTALGAANYAEPNPAGIGITVIGNLIPPAGSGDDKTPRSSFDVSEDVVREIGNHEVSFGGNYRRSRFAQGNPAGQTGVIIYQGVYTSILGGIIGLNIQDGPFADFYLGHPIEFIQGDGFFNSAIANIVGLYGQDKYRITPRFTATYGLRWDPYLPYAPEGHEIDCFRPGVKSGVFTNAPTGLVYPGDPGCPAGGTTAKYSEIQPRVGAAYQLDAKGTSSLRAGYGLYTIQVPLDVVQGFAAFPYTRQFAIQNPFQSISDIWGSNGTTDPFSSGFLYFGYQPPANVVYPTFPSFPAGPAAGNLAPRFRPGYVQQYTVSVQKAFGHGDSVELAYVGTKGTHLSQAYDLNTPILTSVAPAACPPAGPPGTPFSSSTSNEQCRRPYSALGQITTADDIGYSNYNGAQVTYQHHMMGLDLNANFTWSKCIDDGSQPGGTGSITEALNDPGFMRGRCDFDQPYNFRMTAVYVASALKSHGMLTREALGSWIVSANVILDSGQPFSVTDALDNSFTGTGLDRADYASNQPLHANGRLNYSAFTINAPTTLGDTPRNSFRSAPNYAVDTSLQKSFVLTERFNLLFRAEAFNVINHPNYYGPVSALSSANAATFDTYQFARDPRQLQFALKLNY